MKFLFPEKETDLTFIGHLEELRWRIISVIFFFLVVVITIFYNLGRFIDLLKFPLAGYDIQLYYFRPHEKLLTYFKIAVLTGSVITLPFALMQTGLFISPGLKNKECRYLLLGGVMIPLMLFLGVIFSWYVLSPGVFRFFLDFSREDNVLPMWSFGSYFSFLAGLLLAGGMIFQIPFIVFIIISTGITTARSLSRIRAPVIILVAFLGALLSPPDILSQVLLALPMYLLFELSMLVGILLEKRKKSD